MVTDRQKKINVKKRKKTYILHAMENEKIAVEHTRLDMFVSKAFDCSRSQAAKRIGKGHVMVNGKRITKPAKKLFANDVVHLTHPKQAHRPNYQLPTTNYKLLYEDDSCLVINKPSGITVHPASSTFGNETLIEALRREHGENLTLVHRLDKDTTGCLVVAKNAAAAEALQKQFHDRTVEKTYIAAVAGIPKEKRARIEAPIGRSSVNRTKMSLFRTGKSRAATTSYEVLEERGDRALLRCNIATGRTHQIRVHLAFIGHPILGDRKYGTKRSEEIGARHGVRCMLLHAWKIECTSPKTGKRVQAEAPIPDHFRSIV